MDYLLQVSDLEAGYDKNPVLHGISLDIAPGEIVAVIGPNGAGKSTLLKAIFGLIKSSQGSIKFCGRQIQNNNPIENLKKGLSSVLQGSRVFTELSVLENLEVGGYILPKRERKARIEEVFSIFHDLVSIQNRNAGTLSTGQKQMLAMASALMLRPTLLLADEPSLGLGPKQAHATLMRLFELNKQFGTAILLVEQNVREAITASKRVYVLRLGRVVFVERSEKVTVEMLRQVFLG